MQNKAGTSVDTDGTVHILIPLNPYTKKNSQQIFFKNKHNSNGEEKKVPFVSPSQAYKQYAKDCGIFMRPLGIDYPVNVSAKFFMQTRRVVDLTNLNEAIHDIMQDNGVIQNDNCHIIVSTDGSRVYYDKDNPRTEIEIRKTTSTFPTKTK